MRISIITPSFNQGEFIEHAIHSVMNQNHDDVEHIVIDGGSTDNTVSILKKYPHLKWVSEKDSGQSNALNKGFRTATGEILAWLNSDDFYEANVLGEVAHYFKTNLDCMLLYGNITFVDKNGKILYTLTGDTIDYKKLIECPDIVRQPSSFWRRRVVDDVGSIDESFHLVMDLDFLLRIGQRYKFHYLDKNLSYIRAYEQNKTNTFRKRQLLEIYRVFRKQHIPLDYVRLKYFARKFVDSLTVVRALKMVVRPLIKRKRMR